MAQFSADLASVLSNNSDFSSIVSSRLSLPTQSGMSVARPQVVEVPTEQERAVFVYSFFFQGNHQIASRMPINTYEQLATLLRRIVESDLPPAQALLNAGLAMRFEGMPLSAQRTVEFSREFLRALPERPAPNIVIQRSGDQLLWDPRIL